MNIKERINDIRNLAVVSMSKVVDEPGNDVRTIANGKDRYTVEKKSDQKICSIGHGDPRMYDPTIANETSISFKVTDNAEHIKTLRIVKREVVEQGDGDIIKCGVSFGSADWYGLVALDDNTDINDINAIRYQLGKSDKEGSKEMAHFLDKFVIVTPEERKAYKKYEDEMNRKELEAQRAKKHEKRLALRAEKEQARQAKQEAKAKAAQKALQQKVEERFIGRR